MINETIEGLFFVLILFGGILLLIIFFMVIYKLYKFFNRQNQNDNDFLI